MGDELDEIRDELVGKEKVHEEEGIGPDELVGDVMYYDDHHSAVVQLHRVNNPPDMEVLINANRGEGGKLVVLDVGLKHYGLCVKEYPTVVKLSRSMADIVVFVRMSGDENESCIEFAADMESLLGRGDDSFSMEELGLIDTPTYFRKEYRVKKEVRKARQLVSGFIRSTEEVEEKIEEVADKGEPTELVLMIMEEPDLGDHSYIEICLVAKGYVKRQGVKCWRCVKESG